MTMRGMNSWKFFVAVFLSLHIDVISKSRVSLFRNPRSNNANQNFGFRKLPTSQGFDLATNNGDVNYNIDMSRWQQKDNIFMKKNENNETVLTYYGLMLSGAIAKSVAVTCVHPLNVIKTVLQRKNGKMPEFTWHVLSRGAGCQFIMSVPHGALSFAATETTKSWLGKQSNRFNVTNYIPPSALNLVLDLLSSSMATFICSIVSTPQMVISDCIMAGVHPNFITAIILIYRTQGFGGFYNGWLPALVQKIPSYAMTWMFFQQMKILFYAQFSRAGTTWENMILGAMAAVVGSVMLFPMDTVKTRIVTQNPCDSEIYSGIIDCFTQILRKEGMWSLYRALLPRLFSVVPMIAIQFGTYELTKRLLLHNPPPKYVYRQKMLAFYQSAVDATSFSNRTVSEEVL